jgi:hypothetical protein
LARRLLGTYQASAEGNNVESYQGAYLLGTRLDVSLRPTLQAPPVKVSGEVLASREVVAEAIYDTRLRFTDLDAMSLYALGEYIRMAGP